MKFHDGTRFDAAAAKFNLDRSKTDPKSNIKGDLASVDAITVTGPFQITLKLNKVNSALPSVLAERSGLMASPAAFQKFGADFGRNPVGTGPWKFTLWRDNEIVSVRRNDSYRQPGRPYLDGIDFHIIADTNIGLRSVLAGGKRPRDVLVIGAENGRRSKLERDLELCELASDVPDLAELRAQTVR